MALDLPGYGGSDGLNHYGAKDVLNAVVEGVMQLKRRYLRSTDDKECLCILVGHDWGGALSYRIAAETAHLVNRIVIINSMHVSIFPSCQQQSER